MTKQKGNAEDISHALFELSERVLCFHGVLLYEGKVLKIQANKDKDISYFIHYTGWNKSWDEWVPEKRVLKWTDDNLTKQAELKLALATKNKKSVPKTPTTNKRKSVGSGSVAGDSVASGTLSATDSRSSTPNIEKQPKIKDGKPEEDSKKRKRNEFVEPSLPLQELTYEAKQEVLIHIPDSMKNFLIDDWDFITRQKRLVSIPARVTVEGILEEYENHVKEHRPNDMPTAHDLCSGLKEYFNVMASNQLLYRYERQQLSDFEQKCKDDGETVPAPTAIYGAAHLLRLFTKLGGCLAYTTMDPEAVEILTRCFTDFTKFLESQSENYFKEDDYGAATPDYQRKVPA